jgi:PRD domain protein (TIGR03582 family)
MPEHTDPITTMLDNSADPAASRRLLKQTVALAAAAGIQFTETQKQVLANHLIEMLQRSKTGEALPAVDPAMFAEVSKKSLDLAQQVVDAVGNLADSEKYVLSIHFEAAQNQL